MRNNSGQRCIIETWDVLNLLQYFFIFIGQCIKEINFHIQFNKENNTVGQSCIIKHWTFYININSEVIKEV